MYIMYLRKSRADNPDETVEQVLLKHYNILQEFCERELGFRIPEEDIYREIVSGESIDDRVEIKKVLSRVEDPAVEGVVVVEPQRLSRGDLVDCGTLINLLQYSGTLVVTPVMTYNMNNKMERRFFQDELLRGRDYLEYTKEILMRGKLASINRGCYLQAVPPFGYDRVKIGRDNTLAPNADADVVRLIFDMYVNRACTSYEIGRELERLGVKSPRGLDRWTDATIDKILKNYHYIGKVTYQRDKTTTVVADGATVRKRVKQADFVCVEGKHPAIIDEEIFRRAQSRIASRPPVRHDKILRNAFAGLVYCGRCGHVMTYKDKASGSQYICCRTPGCGKSVKYGLMFDAVLGSLEQSELPDLVARYENGEGESVAIRRRLLRSLERELADMKAQEERQYDLLETGMYSRELFTRRNGELREKMAATEERLREAKKSASEAVDYKEKIASLREAISSMKNAEVSDADRNLLLKSIIERIECVSVQTGKRGDFDFSLKVKLRI